jgi:hypothetical protein
MNAAGSGNRNVAAEGAGFPRKEGNKYRHVRLAAGSAAADFPRLKAGGSHHKPGYTNSGIALKESIAYERRSEESPVFMRVRCADSLLFHCYHLFLKIEFAYFGQDSAISPSNSKISLFFSLLFPRGTNTGRRSAGFVPSSQQKGHTNPEGALVDSAALLSGQSPEDAGVWLPSGFCRGGLGSSFSMGLRGNI